MASDVAKPVRNDTAPPQRSIPAGAQPLKRLSPTLVARIAATREELARGRIFQDSTEAIRQAREERFNEL